MAAQRPMLLLTQHELTAADRNAAAVARADSAPRKGRIRDAGAREGFDKITAAVPEAPGVEYEEGEVDGVCGWWCLPRDRTGDRLLLYIHGGGYVFGSALAYRHFAGQFAARLGVETFVPDYRLAPEHPFPAAIDDIRAVHAALAARNRAMIVAGDSAGGGLVLSLLSLLAHDGAVMPCAAAVMSPWTDLSLSGASMASRAEADPIFTPDAVANLARLYLRGADAHDPRASPLFADKAKLPPLRIDVGDDEILLDDSLRYADAAHAAGVDVQIHLWMGMPHVVPSKLGVFEASQRSLDGICAFLRERFEDAAD